MMNQLEPRRNQSSLLSCNGMQLFVTTKGNPNKPPLLLCHGEWQSQRIFASLIEQLTAYYYVIAYDQRGHGFSAKPKDPAAYHIEKLAEDLTSVIQNELSDPTASWSFLGVGSLAVPLLEQYLQQQRAVRSRRLIQVFLLSSVRHDNRTQLQEDPVFVSAEQANRYWNAMSDALLVPAAACQALEELIRTYDPSMVPSWVNEIPTFHLTALEDIFARHALPCNRLGDDRKERAAL